MINIALIIREHYSMVREKLSPREQQWLLIFLISVPFFMVLSLTGHFLLGTIAGAVMGYFGGSLFVSLQHPKKT